MVFISPHYGGAERQRLRRLAWMVKRLFWSPARFVAEKLCYAEQVGGIFNALIIVDVDVGLPVKWM